MSNNNIEEGIKICKSFIEENKDRPIILHKSIENILADRERLEKENKKLKNQDEKDFTLVYMKGYEDCRQKFEAKAQKYDSLVSEIKEEIKNRNIQAKEHKDNTILTIIGREKEVLQKILETIGGEE